MVDKKQFLDLPDNVSGNSLKMILAYKLVTENLIEYLDLDASKYSAEEDATKITTLINQVYQELDMDLSDD